MMSVDTDLNFARHHGDVLTSKWLDRAEMLLSEDKWLKGFRV